MELVSYKPRLLNNKVANTEKAGENTFLEKSILTQTDSFFLRAVDRAKAQADSRRPGISDARVPRGICGQQSGKFDRFFYKH
jgi:hypothetical protein